LATVAFTTSSWLAITAFADRWSEYKMKKKREELLVWKGGLLRWNLVFIVTNINQYYQVESLI
jgi:hypothetical protein